MPELDLLRLIYQRGFSAVKADLQQLEKDMAGITTNPLSPARRGTAVHAADLGVRYMHDGATAVDNAPALNDWFRDGWAKERLPLCLGGRIGVQSTVDMLAQEGFAFATTGGGDARAESQYVTGGIGGIPSGLVWTNAASKTGPILRYRGYGGRFGHLNLYGNWHANSLATLIADTAGRVQVGLEAPGQQSGVGVGKAIFDHLTTMFCVTGIKTLATPTEDNADQCYIGRFTPRYCDKGFWSTNKQSTGWQFNYIDQLNCGTALYYQRGSGCWVGTLDAQGGSDTTRGLVIVGNDVAAGDFVSGYFNIDRFNIDDTADAAYAAVEIAPTTGKANVVCNIGFLDNSVERTTGAMFLIDDFYGRFNLLGGANLYEGLFKVTDGVAGSFPTIRVQNCDFFVGHDITNPRTLFSTDSRGYVQVLSHGNTENYATGAVNGGQFYRGFQGLMNITGVGDGDWTLIGGGWLPKPFSSTAYTVTNGTTDRTFDANTAADAELADLIYTILGDQGYR